ncbi:hypothetical protein LSH36_272g04062 [Paralvinella palmiformis]|uniref:Uncharacterized protein n=1 Tax=Paralvinella palmiformis TaxID=53620 RepID=A0AAD9JKE6_9ANNE|nr:hypothetical protein LSH36_272g04062 [Paralvinella palmiformis]
MIRRKERAPIGSRKTHPGLGLEGIIGRATGTVACHGKTDKGIQVCLGDIYDVNDTQIHVDGSSDDCVVTLSSLQSTSNLLNEYSTLSSDSGSTGNRAPCTTPEPATLKHIIDLSVMDRHIEKLAMTGHQKGEVMSPHELYSRSNPGLCGQGIDYTDPRSWYDSKEAKKLMHSFVRKYNSQLTKPGYSDQRALAKFIVDLPQNLADSDDLARYSSLVEVQPPRYGNRTVRKSNQNDQPEGPQMLHVNNLPSTPPTKSGEVPSNGDHLYTAQTSQFRQDDPNIRDLPNQLNGKEIENLGNNTTAAQNGNRIQMIDESSLQKIGDHMQLKLERKLHIPLPPIFLPKVSTDEMTAHEREIYSEKSWEGKKHLPGTHTDVCFLDHKRKFQDLRLPQHETDVKQGEMYKETYLLRQKSLLKLKTFSEEQLSKARSKYRKTLLRKLDDGRARGIGKVNALHKDWYSDLESSRRAKFTSDVLSIVNSTSNSSCDPIMAQSRSYDEDRRNVTRQDDHGNLVKEDQITQDGSDRAAVPWPYKRSGTKFLYKCPSDGFLNRTLNEIKREKTAVINLDLNGDEPAKRRTKNHDTGSVSNSLQRFLLSRGCPTRSEKLKSKVGPDASTREHQAALSNVQEAQQSTGQTACSGKQRRGYLRKFKRIQVFGESRRPETSHKGKIRWEEPNASRVLPVLRPPENYKMDLNPQGDLWQDVDVVDRSNRPRVTTEHTTVGKTTILIDAPVSGYRKWHRGQVTRPLRIEVTFGKGNRGKPDNKATVVQNETRKEAKREKSDANEEMDTGDDRKDQDTGDRERPKSGSPPSPIAAAPDDLLQADITEAADIHQDGGSESADKKEDVD